MDYRALLIAPLAAVVMSVGAADLRLPAGWFEYNVPTGHYEVNAPKPMSGGKAYEVGIDPASEASGTPSLTVRSTSPRAGQFPGVGAIHQSVAGYAGRRVRFNGQVKAEGAKGWAGLYLGAGNLALLPEVTIARPGKLPPPGSAVPADGQWHDVSVVLDVPPGEGSIVFGLALVGEGQTWARNLRFDVVGAEVATTHTTVGIDVQQVQRVLAKSREVLGTIPPQPLTNASLD